MKRSVLLVLVVFLLAIWFPAFSNSTPLRIPPGDLSPVTGSLAPGGKFPVYLGPGKTYLRPAGGKAAVSSNGWVLSFGMENGWTMIAYEVSDGQYRFGWIEEKSASSELAFDLVPAVTARDAIFTDDPLGEANRLAILKKDTSVMRLARMGIWAYVEAEADGVPARGFVLSDALTYADKAVQYADCLYPIRVDGKWGYMNYQGEIILKPQWAYAEQFRGAGYAVVSEKENNDIGESAYTDGIIDKSGAYAVDPQYGCAEGQDGYYFGGKDTGIIWLSGKSGPDGFFDVASGCFSGMQYNSYFCWVSDEKLITILSPNEEDDWWNSVGFADRTTGELAIPYQYGLAEWSGFEAGFSYVERYESENSKATPLIINKRNEALPMPKGIIPLEGYRFSEERLVVKDTKTGLYGYIDTNGNLVIEAKFDEADNFFRGVAKVKLNGETCYIDKEGRFVNSPKKDDSSGEGTDVENVTLFFGNATNWDESCGLIDGKGTILVPLEAGYSFDESFAFGYDEYFAEGLQVLIKDGKYGFLDTAGNEAVPFIYDDAQNFINGLAYVEKDGKMAYIGHDGNIVWREE